MFNTFDLERLQEAVGAGRCAFGMPFVRARLDGDGRLRKTIGTVGPKTLIGRQESVELFNAAGLPAVFEPEMPLWLRCHAPLCASRSSRCPSRVSAAGAGRRGGRRLCLRAGCRRRLR